VLVPGYKLFLCHTPIKPDLQELVSSRVGCVITRFASFGIRACIH
jgi:hypothetical protein